jgi:phosphoglycerol geranylgeranyltransferase
MTVWEYLENKLNNSEKIHMTLIDPAKQPADRAGEMAEAAANAGTDAIMIGGSTGVSQELADSTIQEIKKKVDIPIILFPTSGSALSQHADAIYFMSLLNSKSVKFVTREQKLGARVIKSFGLEPIPMGYIVVEPGMKVGEVGEVELVKRDNIKDAVEYALSAQYFGMKLVYLEAGSGATMPVPPEMIRAVKDQLSIPLIVGGGLRTEEKVQAAIESGADIIVTGTLVEDYENMETLQNVLTDIIRVLKA